MNRNPPTSEISTRVFLLTAHQYCHILNHTTGNVRLLEGPRRIHRVFAYLKNETMFGTIREKIILNEGQYVILQNPYDSTKHTLKHGEREIRKGPCIFSLHPGEIMEGSSIYSEMLIGPESGLLVEAVHDFEDAAIPRKAGESWLIPGPTQYLPPLSVKVISEVRTISLGVNEGIYIKNTQTGQIRLEQGPKTFFLSPEETLYPKPYTPAEIDALKLSYTEFNAAHAIPLRLLADEIMMIINGDQQRFEVGPQEIYLGPFDRIKVLTISGCTPKKPSVLKLWRVYLGPVFCSDELVVRTLDNAELKILVRYKIRFNLEHNEYAPAYAIEDFIGFTTETMASIIREEAAHHNFEELHSKAAELFKKRIFGIDKESYMFKENRLEIFGLDIKRIVPVDDKIASQLNAAITSNMEVYVKKIQQTAELAAERALVEGKIEIEQTKKTLITLEQENHRLQQLSAAKIDADTMIEHAQGTARATQINQAVINQLELEKMTHTLVQLQNPASEAYLRLEQVHSFNNVEKTLVVPSDAKIWIPFGEKALNSKELL